MVLSLMLLGGQVKYILVPEKMQLNWPLQAPALLRLLTVSNRLLSTGTTVQWWVAADAPATALPPYNYTKPAHGGPTCSVDRHPASCRPPVPRRLPLSRVDSIRLRPAVQSSASVRLRPLSGT